MPPGLPLLPPPDRREPYAPIPISTTAAVLAAATPGTISAGPRTPPGYTKLLLRTYATTLSLARSPARNGLPACFNCILTSQNRTYTTPASPSTTPAARLRYQPTSARRSRQLNRVRRLSRGLRAPLRQPPEHSAHRGRPTPLHRSQRPIKHGLSRPSVAATHPRPRSPAVREQGASIRPGNSCFAKPKACE